MDETSTNDTADARFREQFNVPRDHLPYAKSLLTALPFAESELRTRVAMAVGEASVCWETLTDAGVFDSARAVKIVDSLVTETIRLTNLGKPSLGCATTLELVEELTARCRTAEDLLTYELAQDLVVRVRKDAIADRRTVDDA